MAVAMFAIDGYPCPSARNLYEARNESFWPLYKWSKVNSVWNFRGRRPGEAHLLITKTTKDALTIGGTHTITITHDSGTTDLDGWIIFNIEAIESYSATNQLWYVELKDPRAIGENTSVDDSWTYLTDANNYQDTSTMDWQTVANEIWDILPTEAKAGSASCPTFATAPSSMAENLNFDGMSAWHAICQICEAAGHVPIYNPITQVYTFAAHNATQSGLAALKSSNSSAAIQVWDGAIPAAPAGHYPANISIIFQPSMQSRLTYGTYAKPEVRAVSTGLSGAISGTYLSLIDTSFAIRTDNDLTNGSQLDDRVTDLTRTILGKCKAAGARVSLAYNQILTSFLPGEEVSCVVWAECARKGVYTAIELYEPLKFDLPKPPNRAYSVVEVVRITSSTPDSDGRYSAVVERYDFDSSSWVTQYSCKVVDLNA